MIGKAMAANRCPGLIIYQDRLCNLARYAIRESETNVIALVARHSYYARARRGYKLISYISDRELDGDGNTGGI